MIRQVLSQGTPAQDAVAEGQAVGATAAPLFEAVEDAGASDGSDTANGLETAGVTRAISRTSQRADDPADILLMLRRNLHGLTPQFRTASYLCTV